MMKLSSSFSDSSLTGLGRSGWSLVIGVRIEVASVKEEGAGQDSSGVGAWSGWKGGCEKVDGLGSEFLNSSGVYFRNG